MSQIEETLREILPVDRSLEKPVQAHLDSLTKPQGSLGRLEQMAMQYCLATGRVRPVLERKRIICLAGDHGVVDEGVSAYPKAVTSQMVRNMLAGGAAINVLTRHVNAELVVVDIGVDDALEDAPGLCRKKIKAGTANMVRGPAMTAAEARAAVEVGIGLARQGSADGVHLLGTGEMGIANTTAASALLAGLLKVSPDLLIGRGTGVDDRGLQKKRQVVEKALEVNRAQLDDPMGALAAVGGLEIAGICGVILGSAACRIPVAVDGFISTAGAAVAMQLNPAVRDYLFFCHLSEEKGHRAVLQKLGVAPILDFRMRLGEGTGAALAMSVIEAAVKIYNQMATFGSAGVTEKDGK